MTEMVVVVPVIIISLVVAAGTVAILGRFVKQRSAMDPVKHEPESVHEEEYRLAA